MNIEIGQARALLEYDLRNNPTATFTLTCEQCGIASTYTYSDIMDLIDPGRRPRPLPADEQWALLLYELATAPTMQYRGFFAERLLVEVTGRVPDAWIGTLLRPSAFAPALRPGAQLGGPTVSKFPVCEWYAAGQRRVTIPVAGTPKGSVFAIFFGNKGAHLVELRTANLFCSNPSCNFVFSPTHSQVRRMLATAREKPLAAETRPNLVLTCELCGTSRVVDETSFDDLFQV